MRARVPTTYVVAVPPVALEMSQTCACCGELAAHTVAESGGRRAGRIFVPYCAVCHRHATRVRLQRLSIVLASSLLALTVSGGFPLLWPFAGWWAHLLAALLAASLPLGVLILSLPNRPRPGHTTSGQAVWRLPSGELACSSEQFAKLLVGPDAPRLRTVPQGEPRWAPELGAGWLTALVAAPLLFLVHHPLVRVVNLTGETLLVKVDGRVVAAVEPTSGEDPQAGLELRLPAGRRELRAEDRRGRLIARSLVVLHGGREHLYAPASPEYCYYLETVGYGRRAGPAVRLELLQGEDRFWVLPRQLDVWFGPNPRPVGADRRSSGATLTALRQVRCLDLPDELRPVTGRQQ